MDSMLSKALREFMSGPLNQLVVNLGGEDSATWEEELKKFLRKEPCWPRELLVAWLGMTATSATTKKFVADDNFKLKKDGGLCSYLGDNFKTWFGDKMEDLLGEQTLRYGKLRKSSLDAPIIAELGGEAKAETTLVEVFDLMSKQANGEEGVLLVDGRANIFYVRDKNGVLRAVYVLWNDDGWHVNAYSVESPYTWHEGYQVFSRN